MDGPVARFGSGSHAGTATGSTWPQARRRSGVALLAVCSNRSAAALTEDANSVIIVPELLFRTNPEFRRSLRSWILS